MRYAPLFVLLGGLLVAGAMSMIFIVDERKQAIVLEFGRVDRVETEPGLKFKYPPPINTVVFLEDRILPLETADLELTPADNRRLVVRAFARWRIIDAQRFRQTAVNEVGGAQRLEPILNNSLRAVLGDVMSDEILSEERSTLMRRIRDAARTQAAALGIEVVDVRIRRADLPEQNLQATYDRMAAERQQEAADERARGREAAQRRRAAADRVAVETTSEARKDAEIIRGEADAERNRVFAAAFSKDPEFFAFYRSLQAYEQALRGENSTMVLSPDSEFFRFLEGQDGAGGVTGAAN